MMYFIVQTFFNKIRPNILIFDGSNSARLEDRAIWKIGRFGRSEDLEDWKIGRFARFGRLEDWKFGRMEDLVRISPERTMFRVRIPFEASAEVWPG